MFITYKQGKCLKNRIHISSYSLKFTLYSTLLSWYKRHKESQENSLISLSVKFTTMVVVVNTQLLFVELKILRG